MSSIVLCNTGADSLSFITLDTLEVKKILFALSETPVGPHGIRKYKDEILTANNYSDSISIFTCDPLIESRNIKIGPKPIQFVESLILLLNMIYPKIEYHGKLKQVAGHIVLTIVIKMD